MNKDELLSNENNWCGHVLTGFIYLGGSNGIKVFKEENFKEVAGILQKRFFSDPSFTCRMI